MFTNALRTYLKSAKTTVDCEQGRLRKCSKIFGPGASIKKRPLKYKVNNSICKEENKHI
ncbi:hypothetical protein Hanom_Chr04g00290971 [Helianthus anomalus]